MDDKGLLGGPFRGTAVTRGGARPEFAVRLKSSVTAEENGSALIEATIDVRNQGEGASGELRVRFGRPENEGVDLLEQYQSLDGLEPGAMGTVTLSLRVRDPSALSTVALRLRAQDRSTNVSSTLAVSYTHLTQPTNREV